jgi:2-polyprenyl-3-methyl-5-hydroxy-6-metoxy-1,4-benzoquinol methylase
MPKTTDQEKWNQRYSNLTSPTDNAPSLVLSQNLHLLPKSGAALELACGTGANALLLAKHGLSTQAWDFSEVALQVLTTQAQYSQLSIATELRDVVKHPPVAESFDVIVVSRFLDRSIIDRLIHALRPNGLIYYQTFIQEKDPSVGPNNVQFLLAANELLNLFSRLRIIVYREEAKVGDFQAGFRNEAMIIAQRVD